MRQVFGISDAKSFCDSFYERQPMKDNEYFYFGTPYTKYPDGIEAAFQLACKQTALLIRAGIKAYSPIAHTHPVAIYGGIDPLDHSIWIPADMPFMKNAIGLIVLMASGWEESKGLKIEIDEFEKAGKPVLYMEPDVLPKRLLQIWGPK